MKKLGILEYSDSNGHPMITIEFGCGRAELSRYVSRAHYFTFKDEKPATEAENKNSDKGSEQVTKNATSRPFLLIDRGGPRMKFDTKLLKDYEEEAISNIPSSELVLKEKEKSSLQRESTKHIEAMINTDEFKKRVADGLIHPPPNVERTKMDIKDINLDTCINTLFPNTDGSQVAVISKHLCGCATDLTLECLANGVAMNQNESTSKFTHQLKGVVIALCCRQLCSYETYPLVGRQFLADNDIVSSPKDFKLLTKMTSWAIDRKYGNNTSADDDQKESEQKAHISGFSQEEREVLGQLARQSIDHGRVLFLRSKGYNTKIVQYVDSSVSLENRALICSI